MAARESRETQGAEHTVGVHVFDTGLDVPGAAAHLLVGKRLHAVFLLRAANHRIEAHVAGGLLFKNPDVTPAQLLHLRLTALEFGRHVTIEGAARLNGVVVDANENQIFQFHLCPLLVLITRWA